MLQLQKYDLKVTYKPGKEMYVADTLSRSYLKETKEKLIPETEINAINPRSHLCISEKK
jgi:transposase